MKVRKLDNDDWFEFNTNDTELNNLYSLLKITTPREVTPICKFSYPQLNII